MSDRSTQLATLAGVIKKGIDNRLKDLHTAMPGIIVSFNADKQTASVQPAIKRQIITTDGEKEVLAAVALPPLINVPVMFPRSGGFALTLPVAIGDECLLTFCERSFDHWHQFSGIQNPGAKRFHSLSDAVCYVGLSSIPKKLGSYSTTALELRNEAGNQVVRLLPSGKIEVSTPGEVEVISGTKVTVTSPLTAIDSATITLNGDTTVTGKLTAEGLLTYKAGLAGSGGTSEVTGEMTIDGVEVTTHVHPQANDGAGNTEEDTGSWQNP